MKKQIEYKKETNVLKMETLPTLERGKADLASEQTIRKRGRLLEGL